MYVRQISCVPTLLDIYSKQYYLSTKYYTHQVISIVCHCCYDNDNGPSINPFILFTVDNVVGTTERVHLCLP